jgi:hypothetical protein
MPGLLQPSGAGEISGDIPVGCLTTNDRRGGFHNIGGGLNNRVS